MLALEGGMLLERAPSLARLNAFARADLDNGAGCFMAEHHRRVHNEWADPAMRVIVNIAAADADRVDLYLRVIRPDLLRKVDVAERQLVLALEN